MPVDPNDGQVYLLESGLRFGPFHPDRVWQLEASPLYVGLAGNSQPKAVEAVVYRHFRGKDPRIVFLEAKSSAPWGPRPGDSPDDHRAKAEAVEKFDQEICDKLLHSLHLWLGAAHGWWPGVPLPAKLTVDAAPMNAVELCLVLVVSGFRDPEACEQLYNRLNPRVQRLAVSLPKRRFEFKVLNEATARVNRWCT